MSVKRARPEEEPPKVRVLKKPKVDAEQVAVWEALADDDESTRLSAALKSISNFQSTEVDVKLTILNRLFRGLCSSRKSARLGFYVALVGALSKSVEINNPISTDRLVQIAQSGTTPEPETSGQDERDHFFGRLLACKAIIESGAMCQDGKQIQKTFIQLLKMICELMTQKPWLRNEAMVIICSAISHLNRSKLGDVEKSSIASNAFDVLKKEKLARTIEGLGIWLYVRETIPDIKLPGGIWTSDQPIHIKELPNLKRILLNSRSGADQEEEEALGTAVWSPKLHTAWPWLMKLFTLNNNKVSITFEQFWTDVVDNGLFHPTATPERKFTGFLVLELALRILPTGQISLCFSKNLMATLLQAMRPPKEAYLTGLCSKIFSEVGKEYGENEHQAVEGIIVGLLQGSNFMDFDAITKTRTIASLLARTSLKPDSDIISRLLLLATDSETPNITLMGRKNVLTIVQRAITQSVHAVKSAKPDATARNTSTEEYLNSLKSVVTMLQDTTTTEAGEDFAAFAQEKAQQILEIILNTSDDGPRIVLEIIGSRKFDLPNAEEGIKELITSSKKLLKKLSKSSQHFDAIETKRSLDTRLAMALLLASLLNDSQNGDTASIELLEDARDMARDVSIDPNSQKAAEHIVDLIMSLASKPTKFHRRLSSVMFLAFAPAMSISALQPVIDILKSSEGKEGQLELFENGDHGTDTEEISNNSSAGSIDSDVEVVDAEEDSSSDSETDGDISGESDGDGDGELTAFESALAAALGTRKLTEKDFADGEMDEGEDSDSDMSDSDMLELDEKLAEVFKNQQSLASAQKQRKDDIKLAKENVVILKNRALDLAEQFLRSQHTRGLECSELAITILSMANSTGTQQLSQKGASIVKSYVSKVKGSRIPHVQANPTVRAILTKLCSDVHELISQPETTNAVIDLAGQIHLVLCKLLVEAGEPSIYQLVIKLSESHNSRPEKQRKSVEAFWARYDAWINSVHSKSNESERKQSNDKPISKTQSKLSSKKSKPSKT